MGEKRIHWGFILRAVLFASAITIYIVFDQFTYAGRDISDFFRPAVQNVLAGKSPYDVEGFYSPPWVLVLVVPFALLPHPFDMILCQLLYLTSFACAAHKLGAKPYAILLICTTPQFLWGWTWANNEWMVPLGAILPPQLGLLLVTVKPQSGAPIVIFWLVQAYRRGGFQEVLRVFAPLTVVVLLSVLIFRGELLHMFSATTLDWNQAHFPYLVPVGAILLYRAVQKQKINHALLSAPFLSPYVGAQSLPTALLGLLPEHSELLLGVVGMWLIWLTVGSL